MTKIDSTQDKTTEKLQNDYLHYFYKDAVLNSFLNKKQRNKQSNELNTHIPEYNEVRNGIIAWI